MAVLTPEQFDRAQPKFTPTHQPHPGQKAAGMMIEVEDILPAPVPGQREIGTMKDPDTPGRKVHLAVPHLPYERWIDEAGNVVSGVIKTTRVYKKNGKPMDDGNFGAKMEVERLKAGWVRYDDGLGRPNSFEDVDGKVVRGDSWTPEVRSALIAVRRKDQAETMQYEKKSWLDRQAKESESIQKALTSALESFSDGAKKRNERAEKLDKLNK